MLDSFRPLLSFERRDDDVKMYVVRLFSAIATIYIFWQLAQEPDNLDSLAKFGSESVNDLFDWGNDRFVLGKLPEHSGGNATKRKLSPHEIFMQAIIEEEEESKQPAEEAKPAEEEGPAHNEDEYGPEETVTTTIVEKPADIPPVPVPEEKTTE